MQRDHSVDQWCFRALDVDLVLRHAGADSIAPAPAKAYHADFLTGRGAAQRAEEVDAYLLDVGVLVAGSPHQERGHAGEDAGVFGEGGLRGCVDGK